MPAIISQYQSGQAWIDDLANSILPSNGWVVAKNTQEEKVFGIPDNRGFIGLSVADGVCSIACFRRYFSEHSVVTQPDWGGESSPGFDVPDGVVDAWTIVNGRRVIGILRSGDVYYSFYLGLLRAFGSDRTYPFAGFAGGCTGGLYESAFPFFCGGAGYCPSVCCPDGSWQLVGGDATGATTSFSSFNYIENLSYIFPFDARFSGLGYALDGSIVLYRAMVVSGKFKNSVYFVNEQFGVDYQEAGLSEWFPINADDGQWLGYLDGVYCIPQGMSPGSVFSVSGINYLVVQNVSKASETFAVELS